MWSFRLIGLISLIAWSVACDAPAPVARVETPARQAATPLDAQASQPDWLRFALATRDPERELVLDVRDTGEALLGRLLEAPPNADPGRAMVVRWVHPDRAPALLLSGEPVEEARFVDGGVALITPDHALMYQRAGGEGPVLLDDAAYGPLSVRSDRVAYTRGEAPELVPAVSTLGGARMSLEPSGASPAWCVAWTERGDGLTFVSGASGAPSLRGARAGDGLTLEEAQWPMEDAPAGPSGPVWRDALMVYEGERGLRVANARGEVVAAFEGAYAPVILPQGVLTHARREGGAVRWMSWQEVMP